MTHRTDLSISRKNRGTRTRLKSRLYITVVLLCLWGLTLGWGHAQTTGRGNITGTVTDPTGAVVVGANITVTNMATGVASSSITNKTGYFEIDSLDPATYKVAVAAPGFQQLIESGVTLSASAVLTLPLKLNLGAATEVVTVTTDAPLLNTESGLNGQSVTSFELQSLTMSDNNPMELVEIAPGVQSPAMIAQNYTLDGAIGWNGVSKFGTAGVTNSNEFDIDGAANEGNTRGNIISMSGDMVEQVRTDTTAFDPAIGHTYGITVTETTKSGTNNLHGSGTYTYTNRRWAALDRFSSLSYQTHQLADGCTNGPSTSPQCYLDENKYAWPGVHENMGSFGIGGPVLIPKVFDGRNKLFWFVGGTTDDYTDASALTATIPTVQQRTGNFNDVGTTALTTTSTTFQSIFNAACPAGTPFYGQYQLYDPYNVAIVAGHPYRAPICGNQLSPSRLLNSKMATLINSWLPTPTITGPTSGAAANNYSYTVPQPQTLLQITERVDYVPSERDRIFGRFSRQTYTKGQPGIAPNGIDTQQGPKWGELGAIGWNHVFGAKTNLDVTIGASNFETTTTHYPGYSPYGPSVVGLPTYLQAYAGSTASLPQLQFGGGSTYAQGGSGANSQLFGNTNLAPSYYRTMDVRANMTSVHGAHAYRFGGEWRAQNFARGAYGLSSGNFNFDSTFTQQNDGTQNGALGLPTASNTMLSYAAFLMGVPTTSAATQGVPISISTPLFAGYFGDTWRVTSKLTIMPGLRYEYENGPLEKHNYQITEFDPNQSLAIAAPAVTAYAATYAGAGAALQPYLPTTINVQGGPLYAGVNGAPTRQWSGESRFLPRLGFSYKINDRTVVRGGYGLFFDTLNALEFAGPTDQTNFSSSTSDSTGAFAANGPLGFGETLNTAAPVISNPFPLVNGANFIPALGAAAGNLSYVGASPTLYPHNFVPARSERVQFSVERQFGQSWMVEVGYLGAWSSKMSNFSSGVVNAGGGANTGKLNLAPIPQEFYTGGIEPNTAMNILLGTKVANPFYIGNFSAIQASNPAAYTLMSHSGTYTAATTPISSLVRAYPFMGGATQVAPLGDSRFDELQITVVKRMSHGLDLNVAYQQNYQSDRDFFNNPFDRTMSWEPSNSSYPWRLSVESVYQLPFGHGKMWANSGWKSAAFGGFQLGGTWEFSPGPLIEFGNMFFIGDIKKSNILMKKPTYNTDLVHGNNYVQWLNPGNVTATSVNGVCSYTGTGFVTNGSCQPNSYNLRAFPTRVNGVREMGVNIAMANIERSFKIHEGVNLQMRFDGSNVFNHQTLNAPTTTVTNAQFGQVATTLDHARSIDIQAHVSF